MKFHDCPYMDQLGRDLIEAYRRNDGELKNLATDGVFFPSEEVTSLHQAITKHREVCPVCLEIDRSFANAIDGRITSS